MLAGLAATGLSPVWAQKTPADKTQLDKAAAEKAAADKAAPAKPAPSTAATTATMPSPLTPIQVGELSAVPVPSIAAKAWITVDVTSGQIVSSANPDMKIEPASLTKIMTAYVAFTAIKEKRLSLEQQANVSQVAWKTRGSRMFIEPRKPVTVDELLKGVIIQSGNDASVALAEAVSGSESAFVAIMNEEARRMGMTNTVFVNTTGLPDPQHMTTVRDLAIIARRMINDHPEYFPYYAMREFTYNKIKQSNRNRLLWADPSVDGMKTGHTDAAGYCLVATAKRGDRRVITVLVGSDSMATRAEESLKLLNWTFQNFETVKLFDQTHAAVDARVWQGKVEETKLGVSEPLWVTVPRGKASEIKPIAKRPDPLFAPLTKGERVGTLTLMLDDKMLLTRPLEVLQSVERAGFVGRTVDTVKLWFRKKSD
ncbi:D-alanyl-D-alanine carboxypeptidase family protein [Zwartia sp.]|uniref:D-alanyl-D-alanine carboxypeptidase family protein n=1 Tax=Zwartia sp. TaxID=2978004 RepID=UPI003917DA55